MRIREILTDAVDLDNDDLYTWEYMPQADPSMSYSHVDDLGRTFNPDPNPKTPKSRQKRITKAELIQQCIDNPDERCAGINKPAPQLDTRIRKIQQPKTGDRIPKRTEPHYPPHLVSPRPSDPDDTRKKFRT